MQKSTNFTKGQPNLILPQTNFHFKSHECDVSIFQKIIGEVSHYSSPLLDDNGFTLKTICFRKQIFA